MPRGKFITFEGIEGSGKTAHLRQLSCYLNQCGVQYTLTREPGGTAFGKEVRNVLLDLSGAPRHPYSELLLYLADRIQDLHEVIGPALDRGIHVLCDRYHDATRAYQGFGRGIPAEVIDQLAEKLQILVPDMTIVFEVDVSLGLERARKRNLQDGQEKQGRFEHEDLDFHQRVLQGYRLIAGREPGRFRFVDTNGDFETAQSHVREIVKYVLGS
jgi:dTMP kinase